MTNRKIIAIISAIIVIVSVFASCKQKAVTTAEISQQHSLIPVSLNDEPESTSEAETETSENTTIITTTVPQTSGQTTSQSASATAKPKSQTTEADSETQTAKSQTITQAQHTTKPTTQPSTTQKQTTTKATTTKPSTTKKETTTKAQTVDINYYINYAKSYASEIGLGYDASATDCWDNPISITSTNKDSAIRDIKSRLNYYKNNQGFTDICVWAKPNGENRYNLYIGYS